MAIDSDDKCWGRPILHFRPHPLKLVSVTVNTLPTTPNQGQPTLPIRSSPSATALTSPRWFVQSSFPSVPRYPSSPSSRTIKIPYPATLPIFGIFSALPSVARMAILSPHSRKHLILSLPHTRLAALRSSDSRPQGSFHCEFIGNLPRLRNPSEPPRIHFQFFLCTLEVDPYRCSAHSMV